MLRRYYVIFNVALISRLRKYFCLTVKLKDIFFLIGIKSVDPLRSSTPTPTSTLLSRASISYICFSPPLPTTYFERSILKLSNGILISITSSSLFTAAPVNE